MTKTRRSFTAIACLAMLAAPAAAQAFDKVAQKSQFMEIVDGKDLRLAGIRLNVTPNGEINGRAFGTKVSGEWDWQGSYFCRTLYWGKRDLGQNCQEVSVNGNTIRFQSDRGAGQYADLKMR